MVKKQNSELNLAKFIFSILIVLCHSNKLLPDDAPRVFTGSWIGTEFFFIVSGYLMAVSSRKYDDKYVGKSTFDFVIRKLKSFYPYYIMALIFSFGIRQFTFILKGSIRDTIANDLLLSLCETLLLQSAGLGFKSLHNGPTWYLSAMIIAMMVVFPLLLKFKNWYTRIGGLSISIFIYALTSQNLSSLNSTLNWVHFTTAGVLRAVAGLSLGVFLYGIIETMKQNNVSLAKGGRVLLLIVEVGSALLLLRAMIRMPKLRSIHHFDYIMVIIVFFLCFIIFSELTQINNILPAKLCSFLGKLSLPIYLFHRAVLHLVVGLGIQLPFKKYLVVYLIGTAIIVAIAMFTMYICRLIRKKFGHKVYNALVETQCEQVN